MRCSRRRKPHVRPRAALLLCGLLAVASCAGASRTGTAGHRSTPVPGPTLDAVGSRYVGDPIPITGSTRGVPAGTHRLVLQRSSTHGWSTAAVEDAPDGFYRFADQRASTPGSVRYRTLLYVGKQPAAVSNVVSVDFKRKK